MAGRDRTELNELLASIEAVEWEALEHADGTAANLPPILRALLSPEKPARSEARKAVRKLFRQGSLYSAFPPVAGLLVASLAIGKDHVPDVLDCLSTFAEAVFDDFQPHPKPNTQGAQDPYQQVQLSLDCWAVLVLAAPRLLALMDDADPRVRHGAGQVLHWMLRTTFRHPAAVGDFPTGEVLERLKAEIAAGPEPLVGKSLAAALSEVLEDDPTFEGTVRLWLGPEYVPPVRLVAAEGLLQQNVDCDPAILAALIDGLVSWDPYFDEDSCWERDHLRRAPSWDALVGSLRSIVRYGKPYYDPHLPANASRTLGATHAREWIPFAPHQPPWEQGRPVNDPALIATPLGCQAHDRLHFWAARPDTAVRSRASILLLEMGWGQQAQVETLAEVVRATDGVSFRAAVRAIGKAGPDAGFAAEELARRLRTELDLNASAPDGEDEDRQPPTPILLARALAGLGQKAAPAASLVIRLLAVPNGWRLHETADTLVRLHPDPAQAIDALSEILTSHPDEWVRAQAARLLELVASADATKVITALMQAVQSDPDPLVQHTAADVLGQFESQAVFARAAIYRAFHAAPVDPRLGSARVSLLSAYVRTSPPSEAIAFLLWVLRERTDLAHHALREIEGLGTAAHDVLPGLLTIAERLPERAAVFAARVIGQLGSGSPDSIEILKGLQNSSDPVRLAATCALRRLGCPPADWFHDLCTLMRSWNYEIRAAAAEAVWDSGLRTDLALETLVDVLTHERNRSRTHAALALIPFRLAAFDAAPLLWRMIEDDFEARTRQLDSDPLQWVTSNSVSAAGALWSIGLRSAPALNILAYGVYREGLHRTSLEVVRRLGSAAQPLLPVLKSLQEHRAGFYPTREDRQRIRAAIAAVHGDPT